MTEAADKILVCVLFNNKKVFLNSLTIGSFSSILQYMPITRSAKKKLRQDKKRQTYNLLVKKTLKDTIKLFKKKPSPNLLPKLFRTLDMASKKKIFHPNKVARLKSKFSKMVSGKTPVTKSPAETVKTAKRTKTAKKSS